MEANAERAGVPHGTPRKERLAVQDWGLLPYKDALTRQMDLVELVRHELAREAIVLCSHPPVVTLGRGTQPGDVFGWDGEIVEINRGGRATYHGPSQVVAYPIVDLTSRGRDLHAHMRKLEAAAVQTLAKFGIEAQGRSQQVEADGGAVDATGVWVGRRKIASVGIGVRNWVAFHGIALNVARDPQAFRGLKPCGFSTETMVSAEELLGRPLDFADVKSALADALSRELQA